ncbi:MAG: hypothetical protein IE937_12835, partial [Gammaproteobacteria bacterium]|nr:hypothetical protein [Gammaproteobacteria bacterium]
MSTVYFVDQDGNYLGAFVDGAIPPDNSLEVATPPEDVRAKFLNGKWEMPDPLITWRQTAWREKTKFLIWAKRMGLISANEYLAACRGEWPASFTDALSRLPGNIDPIEAQGVFAAASEFWRMDPVLNA